MARKKMLIAESRGENLFWKDLNEKELIAVQKVRKNYYKKNWQGAILKMLRFQRPLLVNA